MNAEVHSIPNFNMHSLKVDGVTTHRLSKLTNGEWCMMENGKATKTTANEDAAKRWFVNACEAAAIVSAFQ